MLSRVAAAGLLLILAPLLALLYLLVRFSLGSPAIFRQERAGLAGRPFEILKFRTMADARNPDGELKHDSERLTSLGGFLRSTSLDELPEILNILRGEMNFVGPRPLLMEYLPLYSERQTRRHEVKPGLTGWAQINGRNELGWQERLELDVWYVENRSFWLDAKIICKTFLKVLGRQGINARGGTPMERFRGNSQ